MTKPNEVKVSQFHRLAKSEGEAVLPAFCPACLTKAQGIGTSRYFSNQCQLDGKAAVHLCDECCQREAFDGPFWPEAALAWDKTLAIANAKILELKAKALVKAAEAAAFALESVAHLQGRERDLLPITEELRRAITSVKYPFKYRPTLRPVSTFTVPPDIQWAFIEAPPDLLTRPDLPRSRLQYGLVAFDRQLTADERDRFGMVAI